LSAVQAGLRIALAGVLAAAALFKLANPRASRDALGAFGFGTDSWIPFAVLIAAEIGLAGGVAAGVDSAAFAAAAMLLAMAMAMMGAIARGRAGAPCGCFGARSTIGWPGVVRNVALAAAFAAVPFLPGGEPTTDQWLAIGLGVALLASAGLAVAVLALAREVGMLRLQVGSQGALEIPEEGPEVGGRTALIDRFDPPEGARLALAVFSSEGCHMCRRLEPAVRTLESDPVLAVEVFDEVRDADAWEEADVPGSPFAVAIGLDGTVLAKGTYNNLAQLESILAGAARRQRSSSELEAARA
jgi:hypothetical protein